MKLPENIKTILAPSLEKHEGRRKMMYKDSVGLWTVGVGRNIQERGLSDDEIDYLLGNDMELAWQDALKLVPNLDVHSPARQAVIAEMSFNMGLNVLSGFKNTLAAFKRRDYTSTAAGMLNSKWAKQVGQRAVTLAKIMREG